MSSFLHQRSIYNPLSNPYPVSPRSSSSSQRSFSLFSPAILLVLLSLLVILGVFLPWAGMPEGLFSTVKPSVSKWRAYTLPQAASFVAKNGTVIVCAVSQPYLPFLNNWLISISRQKHQDKVLVIAEDYATLYKVNQRWPGHAVLVPPAPDAQTAHKFGSQVQLLLPLLVYFSNSSTLCFSIVVIEFIFIKIPGFEGKICTKIFFLCRGFSILHPEGRDTCCRYWSLVIMLCTMMLTWFGCLIHFLIWKESMMFILQMIWLK
ncbi:hypothetical protein UlMin_021116 [Ulmus minor]